MGEVPASIQKALKDHAIDTVEIAYPDTQAHLRGKHVPVGQFLRSAATKGIACADAAYVWDHRGTLYESPRINMGTGYGDMQIVPDLSTFRLMPWREGTALVIGDTTDHRTHEPHTLDPRGCLRRQVDRLKALGYDVLCTTEVEFYLMTPDFKPLGDAIQCYSLRAYDQVVPLLRDIRQALIGAGIEVEATNTEYGPAQIELNVGPRDAVTACDEAMIVKSVVKELSRRHGFAATFMAKPLTGESGNGLHVHMSLQQKGKNAFTTDEKGDGVLKSARMRNCLAGMLEHAKAMALIGLPSINAYKRFALYSFAPMAVNWSLDNRSALFRCMPGIGAATRIEYRGAAADSNPYLVTASMLAAAADGLERGLEPPAMASGDLYAAFDTFPKLPRTLQDAIPAFEGSRLGELLGPDIAENQVTWANVELAAFMSQVTAWEMERYAEYA